MKFLVRVDSRPATWTACGRYACGSADAAIQGPGCLHRARVARNPLCGL